MGGSCKFAATTQRFPESQAGHSTRRGGSQTQPQRCRNAQTHASIQCCGVADFLGGAARVLLPAQLKNFMPEILPYTFKSIYRNTQNDYWKGLSEITA